MLEQEHFVTEEAVSQARNLVEIAADVVSAYVSNNPVPAGELPALIGQIFEALTVTAGGEAVPKTEDLKPAVPVRKSVTPDYIVCLEDGKKFKSLRRHISTHYGLTPEEYREKWGLPSDYPMVAPNYAAARSALAKTMGLGRKPRVRARSALAKPGRKKAVA